MDKELYENLFAEAKEDNAPKRPQSLADRIVFEAEQEFKGYSVEERSRQDEEKTLKKRRSILFSKMRKYRNIKNPRLRHVNSERSKKRKEIKREIVKCNLRLQEIQSER